MSLSRLSDVACGAAYWGVIALVVVVAVGGAGFWIALPGDGGGDGNIMFFHEVNTCPNCGGHSPQLNWYSTKCADCGKVTYNYLDFDF